MFLKEVEELIRQIKAGTIDAEQILTQLGEGKDYTLELSRQLDILTRAGIELNKEKEQTTVLETILNTARDLTNADAGTVYMVIDKYSDNPFHPGELLSKSLSFEVLQNETLNFFVRSRPEKKIDLPPVPMEKDGLPNNENVSAYCANTGELVNISDVYDAKGFDFSGPKKYDKQTGYRSKSMLVLPLRNHENEINGVLQLINRKNSDGETIPFTENDERVVQSITFQAAVSLTTQKLLNEQIKLFDAFVRVLAEGLGEKSPYTFGHISRVAHLTTVMSKAICERKKGFYKDIQFSESEMEELRLAGWMHDIGKLTTPEHVVSKQIKLQVLCDRFELIVERYNSKIKDFEIEALQQELEGIKNEKPPKFFKQIKARKTKKITKLIVELQTLNLCNTGSEVIEEKFLKVINAASNSTTRSHINTTFKRICGEDQIVSVDLQENLAEIPLVNKLEKEYLSISRGTLSEEERQTINDHAERSWRWLMKLPFPKKKMKLPLFAGAHHETLNGKGYPNKLKANQLPIQSRIIAVCDIFEALTAMDRPYKQPMKLTKALGILGNMVKFGELDAEIIKIFLEADLHVEYGEKYLDEDQIDEIDIKQWMKDFYPKDFKPDLPQPKTVQ